MRWRFRVILAALHGTGLGSAGDGRGTEGSQAAQRNNGKRCWREMRPAPSLTIRKVLVDAVEKPTSECLAGLGCVDADGLGKGERLEQLDESHEEDKVQLRRR